MRKKLLTICILIITGFLVFPIAKASIQAFDSSGLELGHFTEMDCSTGLTCTKVNGRLNVASSPTLAADLTLGDGSAADISLIYDGNAQDYHITLDDSEDDLVIGLGSTAGTTDAIRIDQNQLVTLVQGAAVGIGSASDEGIVFDGNAQDFHISLDDSEDDLVIGLGSTAGTTDAIRIDQNQIVTFVQAVLGLGTDTLSGFLQAQVASTTASLTAVQCGSTIVSNSADVQVLPEASTVLGCRYTFVCGTTDDYDLNPADGTDQIGVINLVGGGTSSVITPSAGDAIRCTDVGSSITLEAVAANLWASIGVANGAWTDVN